jgi:hypothetical protein
MHSTQQRIASEQSVRAGNEHWRKELRRQEVASKVRRNHVELEACGCEKEFFAKMVVDAVMALGEASHLDMIGIKKGMVLFTE